MQRLAVVAAVAATAIAAEWSADDYLGRGHGPLVSSSSLGRVRGYGGRSHANLHSRRGIYGSLGGSGYGRRFRTRRSRRRLPRGESSRAKLYRGYNKNGLRGLFGHLFGPNRPRYNKHYGHGRYGREKVDFRQGPYRGITGSRYVPQRIKQGLHPGNTYAGTVNNHYGAIGYNKSYGGGYSSLDFLNDDYDW